MVLLSAVTFERCAAFRDRNRRDKETIAAVIGVDELANTLRRIAGRTVGVESLPGSLLAFASVSRLASSARCLASFSAAVRRASSARCASTLESALSAGGRAVAVSASVAGPEFAKNNTRRRQHKAAAQRRARRWPVPFAVQ